LGEVGYREALDLQLSCLTAGRPGGSGTPCFFSPTRTSTPGPGRRRGEPARPAESLAAEGISLERVGRGGDITYHGPGQLVGYPIVLMERPDVHKFVRSIEAALIDAVRAFGVESRRIEGLTGVWAGERKIASIGVGVRKWVTYHGFALNVTTDLSGSGGSTCAASRGGKRRRSHRRRGAPRRWRRCARRSRPHATVTWRGSHEPRPRPGPAPRLAESPRSVGETGGRGVGDARQARSADGVPGGQVPQRGGVLGGGDGDRAPAGRRVHPGLRLLRRDRRGAAPPDPAEPSLVANAAAELSWRHVVVTSVTRDDLPDGGAAHFAAVVRALRREAPEATVELLVPDFAGSVDALRCVVDAAPDILAHNVETVPRLYPVVRNGAEYDRSLDLLRRAAEMRPSPSLKSGIMVGLGENEQEVAAVFRDLFAAGCRRSRWGNTCRLRGITCRRPNTSPRTGSTSTRRRRAGSASIASCPAPSSGAPTTDPRYERQTCHAEHPAPGPRCVLRFGGGAGPPGTPWKAGDRGGDERRGVVAAASYEARGFGVHSAMPTATAKRLCPKGIFLPVRMSRYAEMSDAVFAILPAFLPPGRVALHRRGVPRRHGVRAAVRRRGRGGSEDQGGGPEETD